MAAALLVTGALAFATPASATASTAPDEGTTEVEDGTGELRRQRLAIACARIPNVIVRTENLEERLNGDETTIGSLAWLEGRIQQAGERGRDELAEVLENRLEVRRELAELLPLRLEALADAQARCDEADL
jgi:hypothetical protein